MRKKILLLHLIAITALSGVFAVSWRPIADVGSGLTLTHSISTDDAKIHPSYYLEAEIVPLDITIGNTLLGLYASFLINSDSQEINGIRLLGYRQAEGGIRVEYQFTDIYSLFIQAGTGYGVLNKSESGFAIVSGSIGNRFAIFDLLSVTLRYTIAYRSGMLDHRAGMAITITPMGSIKKVNI